MIRALKERVGVHGCTVTAAPYVASDYLECAPAIGRYFTGRSVRQGVPPDDGIISVYRSAETRKNTATPAISDIGAESAIPSRWISAVRCGALREQTTARHGKVFHNDTARQLR